VSVAFTPGAAKAEASNALIQAAYCSGLLNVQVYAWKTLREGMLQKFTHPDQRLAVTSNLGPEIAKEISSRDRFLAYLKANIHESDALAVKGAQDVGEADGQSIMGHALCQKDCPTIDPAVRKRTAGCDDAVRLPPP
jgi:hypothetical protein